MKFYVTGKIIERGILWNSFHSYIVCLLKNVFGGSGVLSPKMYVDVPAEPQKSDLLYTIFLPNNPSISIPFVIEKHPILPKFGASYNYIICSKYTQILNFGSFWWKPTNRYTKFRERAPKRQEHKHIPYQCEAPPPPGVSGHFTFLKIYYS